MEIPLITPLSEDEQWWSILLLLGFLQLLIISPLIFFISSPILLSFALVSALEQTLLLRLISVSLILVFHFSSWKQILLLRPFFFALPVSFFITSFSPVYKQAHVSSNGLSFHAIILTPSFLWLDPYFLPGFPVYFGIK